MPGAGFRVSLENPSNTSNKHLDVAGFGNWYNAVGAGMGAALNTASGMNAFSGSSTIGAKVPS